MNGLEYTWHVANIPPEEIPGIAHLVYQYVYNDTPVKSGNMRSCTYYDYTDTTITVGNDCIYSAYQDYETSLTGWFESACNKAYEKALASYINSKTKELNGSLKLYYERLLDSLLSKI